MTELDRSRSGFSCEGQIKRQQLAVYVYDIISYRKRVVQVCKVVRAARYNAVPPPPHIIAHNTVAPCPDLLHDACFGVLNVQ